MPFKAISYLDLWEPLCSVDWNCLCNFGRVHHEEQFCEIILNWTRGPGDVVLRPFLSRDLVASLFNRAVEPLCNFGRGYYEEQFCEIIFNLDQWLWRKCCLKIILI